MHDPTIYRATFRDLIATVFNREQILKLRIELTMYQESSSPERWTFSPTLPTGRPHMWAPSPEQLAELIEGCFVHRDTDWIIHPGRPPYGLRRAALNVVSIDKRRRV